MVIVIVPEKVVEADVLFKATQEIADSHDFDVYFSFNCILEKLRAAIKDLAEEQTILLVVDELDRCLPEYTITVLERLHHVLEGIPNVQTIISIDKEQLECTVRQIYGCNTNAKRYLEKFISFEITLREGSLLEAFRNDCMTIQHAK